MVRARVASPPAEPAPLPRAVDRIRPRSKQPAADRSRIDPVEQDREVNADGSIVIRINAIKLELIDVHVRGISPLIQHKWDEKARIAIEEKQQLKAAGSRGGQRGRGAERKPRDEWHAARYLDEKGRDCARAMQFKMAMVDAAPRVGLKKTNLLGGVFISSIEGSDLVPLEFRGKEPRLRTDMVRVGGFMGGGTATPRYRPEYLDWGAVLRIELRQGLFSAEQIVNCLQEAGFGVGIGDYRPQKRGESGRFQVAHVAAVVTNDNQPWR